MFARRMLPASFGEVDLSLAKYADDLAKLHILSIGPLIAQEEKISIFPFFPLPTDQGFCAFVLQPHTQ
eukprot:5851021-Pyramimonas_sp.AAC.1